MQILLIMLIVVLLAFSVLLLALAKQSPREKQTEDKEQEEYIRDYAETVRQTGGSMKKLEHWKVIAIYLIIYDIIAVNFSYFMALLVRFDFRYSSIPTDYFAAWRSFAPIYTIIILAVFGCMHIILQTKGTSKHPYVYTAQAVTAIFTVLLGGKSGEAYNVSNPETYCSIYEMGKLVSEKVANGKIKVIVAKNGDISKYPAPSCLKLDISKIENLGWKPEHNLLWMYNRLIKTM